MRKTALLAAPCMIIPAVFAGCSQPDAPEGERHDNVMTSAPYETAEEKNDETSSAPEVPLPENEETAAGAQPETDGASSQPGTPSDADDSAVQTEESGDMAEETASDTAEEQPDQGPAAVVPAWAAAWCGWTEDSRIYTDCLNRDIIASTAHLSSELHLPLFRFDSTEDIDKFMSDHSGILLFDEGYREMPSFREAVSPYDDAFFSDNCLMCVYMPSGSGSFRYGIKAIRTDGGEYCIEITRINDPEEYTCDMAGWLILAAAGKTDIEGCTVFDARYIDRNALYDENAEAGAPEMTGTGDPGLDDAISSVLREEYRSAEPDGLIHEQSWLVLECGTEGDGQTAEMTVCLIVYHSRIRMSGEPVEADGAITPAVITFSAGSDGVYELKGYRTPGTGEEYKKDVYEMFPAGIASDVMECEKYAEQLKEANIAKAREYLAFLTGGDNGGQTEVQYPGNVTYGEFSYSDVRKQLDPDAPGIITEGFVNISETGQFLPEERAKAEVTVDYDSIQTYYDSEEDVWKVHFFRSGTAGGDETVYMTGTGVTILIVYGE